MRKMKKLLAATMALTMLISTTGITACNLGGSRELTSIVITKGSVETSYTLNETVSFEDIVITAKFNDASTESIDFSKVQVFLDGEDITNNLNKITATVGTKKVVIKYEGKEATITITVSSSVGGGGTELPPEPVDVDEYGAPRSYLTHSSKKKEAGTAPYGTEDYKDQFAKGTDIYVAGDDNDFKFLPLLTFYNETDDLEDATTFPSKTVVSLNGNVLDSRAKEGEAGIVEYYAEDTVYLTANTANNTYDFADAAIGRQFKLSVRPDEAYYKLRENAPSVECDVQIVDGFNVYTAKQLGVIDNDVEGLTQDPGDRTGCWADIKEAEGLTDINPAAVIIQNDITVTKEDIPSALQYTLTSDVVYYADKDVATKRNPQQGDKTFLYDQFDGNNTVLRRFLTAEQTFKVYGNYFTIDLGSVPYVASFDNAESDGYGSDFSNACFLKVYGQGTETAAASGTFEMYNLNVKGNAQAPDENSLVYLENESDKKPVSAGGLIFFEAAGCNATLDNIITRTNFIAIFPADNVNSNLTLKNTKVYDSYQNAAFIWGKNTFALENCTFEGAGGPLMLAQHVDPEDGTDWYPAITADDNCIFKNFVTGGEFWFKTVSGDSLIANLKAIDAGVFRNFPVKKSILTKTEANGDDKFNFILLLMPKGSSTDTVFKFTAQGSFSYKGYTLDRVDTRDANEKEGLDYPDTPAEWMHSVMAQAPKNDPQAIPVTFNVKDAFGYLTSATSAAWVPDQTTAVTQFIQGEYLAFNMGGFGLFFEFFNVPQQ